MKKCLYCNESIQNEAMSCIHCGQNLIAEPDKNGHTSVLIPEYDFEERKTMVYDNNKAAYEYYLLMFSWIILDSKTQRMKTGRIWSGIDGDGFPIESREAVHYYNIRRRISIVPEKLLEIESNFFRDLAWISARPFQRTYEFDAFYWLLMLGYFYLAYFYFSMDDRWIFLVVAIVLIVVGSIHYATAGVSERKYENRRGAAMKSYEDYIRLGRKYYGNI